MIQLVYFSGKIVYFCFIFFFVYTVGMCEIKKVDLVGVKENKKVAFYCVRHFFTCFIILFSKEEVNFFFQKINNFEDNLFF